MTPFVAIDWGTSNRRVYAIDAEGWVIDAAHDDRGVLAMGGQGYERELAAIAARHGSAPVLCAGMVGSTIGWRTVPYVPAPAGLDELVHCTAQVVPGVWIVPGVADEIDERADVMRGEEVQLLGAVASELAPGDALLCQPGTHCKWARLTGGRITGITTALTGELFALLRGGGVLARQIGGVVADGEAFRAGVAEGARGDLLASLFGVRALGVLGRLAEADAASYASGVLIGSDCGPRVEAGEEVHLIADAALGHLYAAAIETLGGRVVRVDSEAAFLGGITAIWRSIR